MDIDDTLAGLADHVQNWGGVGPQLWVEMTDGSSRWIDNRSNLATELYRRAGDKAAARSDLLADVRSAAAALAQAETQRLAACRAAFDADLDRTEIAEAAGLTRDGLYKLLRRNTAA
jgi:CRP-like cAMP-binding protein